MSKVQLYSYWRSSCSWRVRIALNLKEIDYDILPKNLVKDGGEQFSPQYTEINPMNLVPSLKIDGLTLIESMNIITYLDETRPTFRLMPEDILEKVKVRTICEIICSGIQPLQNLGLLKKLGEGKNEWAQHWITRGFKAVEKLLEEHSGEYCVGNNITMADCFLVPQVYNARKFNVDLKPFPNIVRIDANLSSHPAFKKAQPSNQPDCPPDAK